MKRSILIIALLLTSCGRNEPRMLTVAVAANFSAPMHELAQRYQEQTGLDVRVISGSSGKLVAQISQGAPFDVFFSADQTRAAQLIHSGLALPATQRNYATGRLALWCPNAPSPVNIQTLRLLDETHRVALANPRLAPYGLAAQQVLSQNTATNTTAAVILGENVAHVYQFVSTGNVDCGFVALSQLMVTGTISDDQHIWRIDESLHTPIRQDAVALSEPGVEFLTFVRAASARALIASHGYRVD